MATNNIKYDDNYDEDSGSCYYPMAGMEHNKLNDYKDASRGDYRGLVELGTNHFKHNDYKDSLRSDYRGVVKLGANHLKICFSNHCINHRNMEQLVSYFQQHNHEQDPISCDNSTNYMGGVDAKLQCYRYNFQDSRRHHYNQCSTIMGCMELGILVKHNSKGNQHDCQH